MMTIAISIKVNDGVVLASDSASTLMSEDGVINVYENANKVANLYKSLPIGIMTWGAGSIGSASTSTLIKDFRKRIMGMDLNYLEWELDEENYEIQNVAEMFKEFIFEEVYSENDFNKENFVQGFLIAGYSTDSHMAEEWKIDIKGDNCTEPTLERDIEECGMSWYGEPEAINRLIHGFDPMFINVLEENGIEEEIIKTIVDSMAVLQANLIFNPMPIQDVIDLSRFFVELTKNYSRFKPGAATVGGPTEVAAITKHEGYKWVTRKHYYTMKYNPQSIGEF